MTATSPQPQATADESAPPLPGVLERNLSAISRLSPDVALDLPRAEPAAGWSFSRSGDGSLTGEQDGRLLASRRSARAEGERFADGVDIREAAVIVVLGFGAGHHVRAIGERLKGTGLLVVFEPDRALLKAVLEREEHAAWASKTNLIIVTDPADSAGLGSAIRRHEAMLGLGVKIVEHAASAWRLGEQSKAFLETFAQVTATARTALVTSMVQTEATIRNVLMNLDYYAGAPGIAELRECALNRPCVVVSAGPSLERNMRLLAREGVRDRCVIIAVQTALKPLLRAGVRPHYVVALDHHEISRRFYEGLTAEDVAGVTLVAEPKANPLILQAFPGVVRCPREEYLDVVLGSSLFKDHGGLPAGSTVAHLAYYLARYMGCDPVALIGQDLGFTDGQYYAAGAAIHDVWAGELNPFNTLETLEWQRIVRAQMILHASTDHLGRRIYTDEQMRTYLAQFERDFRADEAKGLTTIDATEGGVRKAFTSRRCLQEFLDEHIADGTPVLNLPPCAHSGLDRDAVRAATARVREIRKGVWRVGDHSRQAAGMLAQMLEHHDDQARVNRLIGKVHALREAVVADPAPYNLVHRMNQTGTFRRARADRQLLLSEGLSENEQQRKHIERDLQNVRWLAEASDALGNLLDTTARAMEGGPKLTRDLFADAPEEDRTGTPTRARPRVGALVSARLHRGALGQARGLAARDWSQGKSLLAVTVERIARTPGLECVVVLTDDAAGAEALLEGHSARARVAVREVPSEAWARRDRAVSAARSFAGWCWRGGPGHMAVYDEILLPAEMLSAMQALSLDGALVLGADWCAADPDIAGLLLERHAESPERFRIAFTQAAPGLVPALIDAHVMANLAEASADPEAGPFASFGGLMGYIPIRPKPDPIAQPVCINIDTTLRDAAARWIADTSEGETLFARANATVGPRWSETRAVDLVRAGGDAHPEGPGHLIVELTTKRATGRRRAAFARGVSEDRETAAPARTESVDIACLESLVRELAGRRNDLVVTFAGTGDPALHPALRSAIERVRDAGAAAVHVRTDLIHDDIDFGAVACADVVSVDVSADTKESYVALTGREGLERLFQNVESLAARRDKSEQEWLGAPWIVARMTRCDAVYEEIESFYNRWLLWLGAAVLDPMPDRAPGERIARLPTPRIASDRFSRERMLVLTDGRVVADERDSEGRTSVGNAFEEPPLDVWRRLVETRHKAGDAARDWTMYA